MSTNKPSIDSWVLELVPWILGKQYQKLNFSWHKFVASMGVKGGRVPPWQWKICQKLGKKGRKSGKNGKKRNKIGKKKKNHEGSVTLPLRQIEPAIHYCQYVLRQWHNSQSAPRFFTGKFLLTYQEKKGKEKMDKLRTKGGKL